MLKAVLAIGGLQAATMVVLLARTKVLAVGLGPEAVGLMAVIDKLLALAAQTAALSLPFAALRFLPGLWNSDRAACYAAYRSMALTVVALASSAALAGSALALFAPGALGAQLAPSSTVVAAAFVSVPALALAPLLQNAFAGILRHRSSMLLGLAHAAVQAAAGLVGVLASSLAVLYLSYAGGAAMLLAVAAARLRRALGPMRAASGGWRGMLPPSPLLRFSAAMFGLSVFAPFAALFAHYLVLEQEGAKAAGWMQAAFGVSLAVRALLGAAHPVYLTPQLNQGGSWQQRMALAARFQSLWCLLAGVLLPPLLLFPDLAVVLLYAGSFAPATPLVQAFVLAEVLGLLAATYQGLIVAADRMRFHVAQNIAAQLLMMALAWWWVPRIGILGAAVAAIAAQCLLYACTAVYLARHLQVRPPARTTALSLGLLLLLTAVGQLGARSTGLGLERLAVAAAVYAAVLVALLAFAAPADRRWLLDWMRRRPRGDDDASATAPLRPSAGADRTSALGSSAVRDPMLQGDTAEHSNGSEQRGRQA